MSEHWQLFTISELNTIGFQCPHCKTTILFAADGDVVSQQARNCPGCNKEMQGVGKMLTVYRQFCQENARLSQDGIGVTLRAKSLD